MQLGIGLGITYQQPSGGGGGITKLPNGARVMHIGHSFVALGTTSADLGAAVLAHTDRALLWHAQRAGAGIRIETFNSSDPTQSPIGSSAKYYSGSNYGRGSETAAQTLARFDDATEGALNVETAAPEILHITTGLNDDWSSGFDGTVDSIADLAEAFLALPTSSYVVIDTITPKGTSSTGAHAENLIAVNQAIRALGNGSTIFVADVAAAFGLGPEATEWAQAPAGFLYDNVHPSALTAGIIGRDVYLPLYTQLVEPGHDWFLAYPRASGMTDTMEFLQGSANVALAWVTGTRPTNLTITRVGTVNSTFVMSVEPHPLAGTGDYPADAQRCKVVINSAGANVFERVELAISVPATSAADTWLQGMIGITTDDSDKWIGFRTEASEAGTTPNRASVVGTTNGTDPVEAVAGSYEQLTHPFLTSSSPPGNITVKVQAAWRCADAVAAEEALTLYIDRVSLRAVDDPRESWNYA